MEPGTEQPVQDALARRDHDLEGGPLRLLRNGWTGVVPEAVHDPYWRHFRRHLAQPCPAASPDTLVQLVDCHSYHVAVRAGPERGCRDPPTGPLPPDGARTAPDRHLAVWSGWTRPLPSVQPGVHVVCAVATAALEALLVLGARGRRRGGCRITRPSHRSGRCHLDDGLWVIRAGSCLGLDLPGSAPGPGRAARGDELQHDQRREGTGASLGRNDPRRAWEIGARTPRLRTGLGTGQY